MLSFISCLYKLPRMGIFMEEETIINNLQENKSEHSHSGTMDKYKSKAIKFFKNILELLTLRDLSIIMMVMVIYVIGYFILFPSKGFISSDSVDTLMWAQASYDAGSLFNPDFTYACLLPFGGQLIMIPLVALFGVTKTALAAGMLIFFCLFTAAFLFMLRKANWGWGWSCFTASCLLMILSGSEKLREIFWEHIIYYSLGLFFMFVGMGLVFKAVQLLKDNGLTRKFYIYTTLTFVWCALTATDQLEALTLFLVPAIGALIGERFFSFEKSTSKEEKYGDWVLITVAILGTALGFIIGNKLKNGLIAGYESAYSSFSAPDTWFEHLGLFFTQWTSLLGVSIADCDKILTKDGIYNLLKIILSLILLVAPIIATILYPKIKDRASRVLILFHWIMTALIMMGFIFGKLYAANWRLSPIVATSVLITMMLCRFIALNTTVKRLMWLMILPILIVGEATMSTIAHMPANYKQNEGLYTVAAILKDNNLTYGYATFWNANALTVISDSEIKSRNIEFTNTFYAKKIYQSQSDWYNDQPDQEKYFVLVTTQEYETLSDNANALLNKATDTIKTTGYTILVFDNNIF